MDERRSREDFLRFVAPRAGRGDSGTAEQGVGRISRKLWRISSACATGRPRLLRGSRLGFSVGRCSAIYKALTAVKLAEQATAAGVDAVPVFWLATYDHDLAEVNHVSIPGRGRRAAGADYLEPRCSGSAGECGASGRGDSSCWSSWPRSCLAIPRRRSSCARRIGRARRWARPLRGFMRACLPSGE